MRSLYFVSLWLVLLVHHMAVQASPLDYYDTHAKGWHWYETIPEDKKPAVENVSPLRLDNAMASMRIVQKKVEAARDLAILKPTPTNVKYYLTLQNQVSDRASLFANTWKKVLLEDPNLDENLKHPSNALGRQVDVDLHQQAIGHDIKIFTQHSGLFFFYRGQCPYCHQFAPILKAFAQRNHIAVIAITLDDQILPEFPDSKRDIGQAGLFSVQVVPALFAVDPHTHQAVPVGFGLMSEEELQERIAQVAKHWGDRTS